MIKQIQITPLAWAQLGILAFIWGGSFLALSLTLREMGPITSIFHRTFWAIFPLWIYVYWWGFRPPKSIKIWGQFMVMGLLNNVIPFGLMAWGQLTITSGLTSILNASTAIFGVIVAAIVFSDERLTPRKSIGVLVGFAGVMIAMDPRVLLEFSITSLAQLAVIGGAMAYAFAGAFARWNFQGIPPELSAACMVTCSGVMLFFASWFLEGLPTLDLNLTTLGAIGYLSIFATAGAYLLYYRVLASAGSGYLMICTLLVSPIALALGIIVLGEPLSNLTVVGFLVLAVGLIILNSKPRAAETTAQDGTI